jgi:hypothetical protein
MVGWTLLAMRAGGLLQLGRRYGHCLGDVAIPRADPVEAHFVGPSVTRPRDKSAVPLGLALLPSREDAQGVLATDESHGPTAL